MVAEVGRLAALATVAETEVVGNAEAEAVTVTVTALADVVGATDEPDVGAEVGPDNVVGWIMAALARRDAFKMALRPPVGRPRSRHRRTMVAFEALSRSVARRRASAEVAMVRSRTTR